MDRAGSFYYQPLKVIGRVGAALALAAFSLGGSACSTTNSATVLDGRERMAEELNLDPMLIRASADGDVSEVIEVQEVFELAYQAYSERKYERAADHYKVVFEYFPESKYYIPALYNAGLSYENLEHWEAAAACFQQVVEAMPQSADALDATFRLANAWDKSGEHEQVVDLMTEVLLGDEVSHFDRVEAYLRRSDAQVELGHWSEAEDGYLTLLKLNRNVGGSERLSDSSTLIVQAYFGLGQAFHAQVRRVRLVLPPERMGDDLNEKARLFTAAQANYLDALRQHHPQWSMAAGYMIGKLYEDFYTDIFNAEIPDHLSEEHIALYFEELRKQIRPLMERAIQVYEKNLSLSKRLGARAEENEWVNQTSNKLERLRDFLEDPITQRRAEILVANGHILKQPWDPRETALDLVDVAVQKATLRALEEPEEEPAVSNKPRGPES